MAVIATTYKYSKVTGYTLTRRVCAGIIGVYECTRCFTSRLSSIGIFLFFFKVLAVVEVSTEWHQTRTWESCVWILLHTSPHAACSSCCCAYSPLQVPNVGCCCFYSLFIFHFGGMSAALVALFFFHIVGFSCVIQLVFPSVVGPLHCWDRLGMQLWHFGCGRGGCIFRAASLNGFSMPWILLPLNQSFSFPHHL